jgi:manganese/zinc/iron transport system substrate-binding protein
VNTNRSFHAAPPRAGAVLFLTVAAAAAACRTQTGGGAAPGSPPAGHTPPMFARGEVRHEAFVEPPLEPGAFSPRTADEPVRVTVTVGQITDIAEAVGGDRVIVTQVIPGNDDPHLYVPSPRDVAAFSQAELILYNGLYLEGQLGETFERMRDNGIPTVAVTAGLSDDRLLEREYTTGRFVTDPHVWFDPEIWAFAAGNVATALAALDPAGAEQYAANLERLKATYGALEAWGRERMAGVPETRRVLVTSHDAFQYFGRRFGVEVRGLQGLSTEVEAGMRDVVELTDFIVARDIPAVFVEASVSPEALQAVVSGVRAEGGAVRVGGQLYSDTPGPRGTAEGTYPGMVIWNVVTVVKGLGGDVAAEVPPELRAYAGHDLTELVARASAAALAGEK